MQVTVRTTYNTRIDRDMYYATSVAGKNIGVVDTLPGTMV